MVGTKVIWVMGVEHAWAKANQSSQQSCTHALFLNGAWSQERSPVDNKFLFSDVYLFTYYCELSFTQEFLMNLQNLVYFH